MLIYDGKRDSLTSPLAWMFHQRSFTTHQVQMYAAAERPEVTFVFNKLGLESSLEQVPCPRVSFGTPIRVANERVLHPTRQVGLRRPSKEVVMIRNPDICKDLPTRSRYSFGQDIGRPRLVTVVRKNSLTTISPCDQIIICVRKFYLQWSRHAKNVPRNEPLVNSKQGLTPTWRMAQQRGATGWRAGLRDTSFFLATAKEKKPNATAWPLAGKLSMRAVVSTEIP